MLRVIGCYNLRSTDDLNESVGSVTGTEIGDVYNRAYRSSSLAVEHFLCPHRDRVIGLLHPLG